MNFKVANNELQFMSRICPESAQIFCFTFINIYTARLSDWTQTLLLTDGFIIPKVQCVQQVWKCTPLHKCEQKYRTKTLITFPDTLILETMNKLTSRCMASLVPRCNAFNKYLFWKDVDCLYCRVYTSVELFHPCGRASVEQPPAVTGIY